MMRQKDSYRNVERMHDYSSLFSYASWSKTLNEGCPSDIISVYQKYDEVDAREEIPTFLCYLESVYRCLLRNYRNEYIYKNELLSKLILKLFGKTTSVAVNEFRVGDSVADLALFNGESKCFEIKSELDSPQRLSSQLECYQKVFEQCYIMVPIDMVATYRRLVDDRVGIITLRYCRNGQVSVRVEQPAMINESVDVDVLMRSVRASEYRWMIKRAYGKLPDVSDFDMYEVCKEQLRCLSSEELHRLFKDAIKMRSSKVSLLKGVMPIFRQMSLSMNLSSGKILKMNELYNHKMLQ